MKLDKEIKTELHEAHRKKKPLKIKWPSSKQPIAGHTYKLDNQTSIRVERFHRTGWEALVRLDHDPHYILHGLAGVRNEDGDYVPEPEAIRPSAIQAHMLAGHAKTELAGKERRDEGKLPQREQRLLELRRRGMTVAAQRVEEQIARSKLAEAS